ncbi:hypothetical protein CI102_10515 [Trichoderma harzianum]|nr:hypothetical protein CI102_10515 [Trichoderma harzianum]
MPSLNALSTALLACAGSAVATQFTLADTYDHTNFFSKFTFNNAADTNSGFVVYQDQANAQAQGLAKITSNNEVYLGVDTKTVLKGAGFPGRNSIRLESKASYKHGLIVARFSHLPTNKCGSWPSFWTLGDSWPNDGEIDVYEGWNNIVQNQPAFHVGDTKTFGQCILENAGQTASVATPNCDNTFQSPPSQYLNQGCTANDNKGPWASSSGGTYAIEWTSDYIKLYNWHRGAEPANLASSNPDTATWGTPAVNLQGSNCNIDKHFNSQRLILDIDFCGNPVGTPAFWQQSCAAVTKQATCADYVAKFPGDFAQTYFQIQDIRYFSQSTSKPTTSKAVTSSKPATSKPATSSKAVTSSKPATSSKAATSKAASSAAASSAAASSAHSSVVVPTSVIASLPPVITPSLPPVVTTSRWSNSSAAVTTPAQLTTSTVYTTRVHTISQCGPEVTNCPFRPTVTTETVALYTTVCPVEEAESSSSAAAAATTAPPNGSGPETLTTAITIVHTITSCAPDVTNCPARHSTQVIPIPAQPTGVAPPVAPVAPAPPVSIVPVMPIAPAPSNAAGGVVPSYPVAPAPSAPVAPVAPPPVAPVVPVAPVAPSAPAGGNGTWTTVASGPTAQPPAPSSGLGCSGADCLPPLGSGAVRTGMSTLALVGAMAVMLL